MCKIASIRKSAFFANENYQFSMMKKTEHNAQKPQLKSLLKCKLGMLMKTMFNWKYQRWSLWQRFHFGCLIEIVHIYARRNKIQEFFVIFFFFLRYLSHFLCRCFWWTEWSVCRIRNLYTLFSSNQTYAYCHPPFENCWRNFTICARVYDRHIHTRTCTLHACI